MSEPIPMSRFILIAANITTNHPFKTLFLSLLPSLLSLTILLTSSSIIIQTPTHSDYYVRTNVRTELEDARIAIKQAYSLPINRPLSIPSTRTTPSSSMTFALLFRAPNVLSRHILPDLKRMEDYIISSPGYTKFCVRDPLALDCSGIPHPCAFPLSILNSPHLYGIYNQSRLCNRATTAHPISKFRFKAFLANVDAGNHSHLLGNDIAFNRTQRIRSIFPVATPFEGFYKHHNTSAQHNLYDSWFADMFSKTQKRTSVLLNTYLYSVRHSRTLFNNIIRHDIIFVAGAMVFVFLIMCFHLHSIFLACIALVQIFLAFPLAFVIYYHILRQQYFSVLHIFAIFLLLGTGADDVFIFTDAWKRTGYETSSSLQTRMTHVYGKVAGAMAITSATTAIAFLLMIISPIMPVATFGVWACILILVQFTMTITVYPSAITVWKTYLRPGSTPIEENERLLERIFHGDWTTLLHRIRFLLSGIAIVWICIATYIALRLKPQRGDPQLLPSEHAISRAGNALKNGFSRTDSEHTVQLMWGIRGIDRHGTSRFRTDKTGKAKLDFDFDLRLASTQRHVVQTCGRMRKLKVTNGVRCWMEEFVKWKMGNGRAKYENYTSGTGLVYDILAFGMAETASGQRPYVKFLTGQKVLMRADLSDVVCVEIEMGMKAGENGGYERWQTELSRVNGRRRKGNGKAVMTGGKEWLWEVTQMTIEASMVVGIAGMLGLCTAMVWGMTLNIRVAVLAGGSLYGVAVSLLAGVEIMGWDIGVAESICAVLAVGYSFDGVAHVAIGYARGTAVGRVERMRETLGRIGISVVFGLVSTAGSAGILLAATIVLLVRLGALVLMTMALTAVWSLVLLPAMLLTMGPKEHA